MYKYICIILFSLGFVNAQDLVSGTVYGDNPDNPLPGANVYWLSTDKGTVTIIDGRFFLQSEPDSAQLIISYVGFISDTLTVRGAQRIVHVLQSMCCKVCTCNMRTYTNIVCAHAQAHPQPFEINIVQCIALVQWTQ